MVTKYKNERFLVIDNFLDDLKLAAIRQDISLLKESGFINLEPNEDRSIRQDTVVWIAQDDGQKMKLQEY